METSKTHWRTIAGKKNIVGELLQDKDVTMTIREAKKEDVINVRKTMEAAKHKKPPVYESKGVLYFEKTDMKLILNPTNYLAITDVLGSPYIEDWKGKQITLTPLKGRWFGEDQTAVRIKKDYSNVKV